MEAVLIHAVYLLNCASEDRTIRQKSRRSLIQSLHVGAGIGAIGVVLHPGSAKKGDVRRAISLWKSWRSSMSQTAEFQGNAARLRGSCPPLRPISSPS